MFRPQLSAPKFKRCLVVSFCFFLYLGLIVSTPPVAADDGINPDATAQLIRASVERNPEAGAPAAQLKNLSLAAAVAQFYERRQYRAAWSHGDNVDALIQELINLSNDGLNPADYQLAELQQLRAQQLSQPRANPSDPKLNAQLDIVASRAYLRALSHLFRGKVNPATLSAEWNFASNDMTTEASLTLVSDALTKNDIGAAFNFARPHDAFYSVARAGLAQLRARAANGGWPTLDKAITLKPGITDHQVVLLRQRLNTAGYLPESLAGDTPEHEVYDDELTAAVQKFQREHYLDDDGAIGPATRNVLNISVQARINQIRVNLERDRWLLRQMPDTYVLIDVAGYQVSYFRDAKELWKSNVQVGKAYRSTPIFRSQITYITFNPTWTVPPTILQKDILPKLRRDTRYLAKNNIRVLDNSGRELNATQIDWNRPGNIMLRQDAGPENSLGQVVIRFPNSYSVYMHDTPHKELFGNGQRAFSSGCIRVEHPLELVELLFNDPTLWNRANIDQIIAEGKTRNVNLKATVPVLLTYWTIEVIGGNRIVYRPDIYQRDAPVLRALDKPL